MGNHGRAVTLKACGTDIEIGWQNISVGASQWVVVVSLHELPPFYFIRKV